MLMNNENLPVLREDDNTSLKVVQHSAHPNYQELLKMDSYTPQEAAELLLLSPDQIRQAVFARELKGTIVDHNVIRISRVNLLEWLSKRK